MIIEITVSDIINFLMNIIVVFIIIGIMYLILRKWNYENLFSFI